MLRIIKKNWSSLADRLAGTKLFWYKSPSGILLFDETKKVLRRYCRGRVLDIGAGRLAYRPLIKKYCKEYTSIDFKKTSSDLDYIGDAQDMNIINDESFETVFCSQVLEHVPEPQKIFSEIERILKPGGCAIISVPFLGYLHNEPHDYFRYTKHSLKFMSEKAGLEVIEIKEIGGLFSCIGYLWSTIFLGLLMPIPFVGWIAFGVNVIIAHICIFLDAITMNKKLMPLNYSLIIKK